jgi:hypothetical protein
MITPLLLTNYADPQKPNEIRGARFTTEMRAGLTTFFTMAYIIAVNVSLRLNAHKPEQPLNKSL